MKLRLIDCESHGDEVLNRQLGLAVSWCDVDDELVAFALQHLIQRIAYSLVVVSDNKPLASVLLEEVPSEVEGFCSTHIFCSSVS